MPSTAWDTDRLSCGSRPQGDAGLVGKRRCVRVKQSDGASAQSDGIRSQGLEDRDLGVLVGQEMDVSASVRQQNRAARFNRKGLKRGTR